MANSKDPGLRTVVEVGGEKELKAALSNISSGMKVLQSDMDATQSSFAGEEKSIDALLAKQKNLAKQYELQAEKVDLYAAQLEKALTTEGTSQKKIDDLEIAYNKAKTTLNNMATSIDQTTAALEGQVGGVEKSTKAADEQEGSAQTLAERQKELLKQYQAQNEALDSYSARLEIAQRTQGTSQEKLDELEAAYLKAKQAVNQTAGEIDEVSKAMEAEADQAGESTKETGKFSEVLSAAGNVIGGAFVIGAKACAAALTAVAAAATAAVAASFDMAKSAGEMADNMLTLSQQTGVSAEDLQKWSYASEFMDTPVDTITKSMAKMTKAMGDASKGSDTSADKFKRLGVSITDSSGNLRDSEDVFMDAIDALGNVSNEAERDALAMDLFGKSAQELNPLILTGGAGLRALGDEAKSMGTVFSEDALGAMGSFDDSMQRFNLTLDGMKNAIGMTAMPLFQPLLDAASGTMGDVSLALQDGLQPGEIEAIIGNLMATLETTIGGLGTTITNALPIVTAALTSLVSILAQNMPALMEQLLPAAMGLLQGVLDAIVQNIEPLTAMAVSLVTSIATFLMENTDKLLDAALGIVTGLMDGIIENLPQLVTTAVEMMIKLATSLVEAIPELAARLPEIVTAILTGLAEVDWLTLGVDLIQGLINGLISAVSSLGDAINAVFEGIWKGILKVFGIASPSTEAEGAAGFILDGLLNGFLSAVDAVVTKVKEIFGKIWDAIKSIFGFGGGESDESKQAKEAGKDIMTGMQDGITGSKDALETAITNVSKDALARFVRELGITGNTSTKTKPYGEAAVTGINDGLKSKAQASSFGGANDVATAAANALNSAFGVSGTGFLGLGVAAASKFEYIGQAVCQGIANGINNGQSIVTRAAENMAQAAYDAAAAKLDIHSPSRVAEQLGLLYGAGFAVGIERNRQMVMDAASNLSSMAVRGTASEGAAGAAIDYERLADAITESMIRAGIDNPIVRIDKNSFTTELEPGISQATRQRGSQTAQSRTNQMVFA